MSLYLSTDDTVIKFQISEGRKTSAEKNELLTQKNNFEMKHDGGERRWSSDDNKGKQHRT